MSPGRPKWLPKLTFSCLGQSISRFREKRMTLILPYYYCVELTSGTSRKPFSRWRGRPESNKTCSCFRDVSMSPFSCILSEKCSKDPPPKTPCFHFFDVPFCRFAADSHFQTLFVKVRPKTLKKAFRWHLFWTFFDKVGPKTSKRASEWTREAFEIKLSGKH